MFNIVSRRRSLRRSPSRKLLRALVAFFLFLASLAFAGVALADGGTTIASAPTISFGVQYFGNTVNGSRDASWDNMHEYWTMALIAGDSLTVNFKNAVSSEKGVNYVYLYGPGTNDYNIGSTQELESAGLNANYHGQLVIGGAPKSGAYVLDFRSAIWTPTDDYLGPYDFTAYVKHAVRLQANSSTLRYRGTWTVGVHYADGSPINDSSLSLKLYVKKGCCWKVVGKGTVSGGKAAVKYALPKSAIKHVVRLKLIASGSAYTSSTVTRSVHIRK